MLNQSKDNLKLAESYVNCCGSCLVIGIT